MKKCTKCSVMHPEDFFNWKVRDVKRSLVCKDCHREYRKKHYQENRKKYIEKAKRWKTANDPAFKRHNLKEEEFGKMLSKFDGMCWCCKTVPATVIDHDHGCCSSSTSCGKCVRGLLCRGCNLSIGRLGDSLDGVRRAVVYLETYESRKH